MLKEIVLNVTIKQITIKQNFITVVRGGCRDFEKGGHSMSATMVGQRKKKKFSDGLKRPK